MPPCNLALKPKLGTYGAMVMDLLGRLRDVWKPTLIGRLAFCFFSSAFITGYFLIAYQQYLGAYKTLQAQEIEAAHQKTKTTLKQLKEFLDLSGSLIFKETEKTLSKTGLTKESRVRKILNAVSYLRSPSELPSFQKITFYKLSFPQMLVTRWKALPLVPTQIPLEKLKSQNPKPEFSYEGNVLVGRVNVGKHGKALDGILEIQVNMEELKSFLGTYKTLHLDTPSSLVSVFSKEQEHLSYLLVQHKPLSFWVYVLSFLFHHWVLVIYIGASLLLLGLGSGSFYRYTQKSYKRAYETWEKDFLAAKAEGEASRMALERCKNDFDIYTVSHQAHHKFHQTLTGKQKSQAKHIADFLELLKNFGSSISVNGKEVKDIQVEICLKQAQALSNGLWHPEKAEIIDVKNALKNLGVLFAEKLHQSNIHFAIENLPELPQFQGDLLLIDVLLMNVVGKAVYRVPENGTVSVMAKEASGFLHLQVQDTGYGHVMLAEEMIQQSFSLFLENDIFKKLCKENGIYKKYSRSPQGFNVTHLFIPIFAISGEVPNSNVVRLFT